MDEQLIGHYRIISPLGAGGMGEVYLAEDTKLGRRVAIKFLSPELIADERANKRLTKEARAAATLDHPNICAIHEVGEEKGRCFIVMQYVEGETLEHRLKSQRLPIEESLSISTQVAEALAEAHSHGIIHRDIKPANIMITKRGHAKVMDFGLAKLVEVVDGDLHEAETQTFLSTPGTVMGTLPYMSPEQVRGESLDGRSDIFSFGVVFYEMLSGRQPFSQKSAAATASAILTHEPPPVTQSDNLESLQQIIGRCLEKNREHRYQTMSELARDLASATHEKTIGSASSSKQKAPEMITAGAHTSMWQDLLLRRRYLPVLILAVILVLSTGGYFLFQHRASSASQPPIKSLAVLPLKPFDPGDNSLGLGIADAVIRKISQTGQLIVRPTSAVRHYLNEDTDALTAAQQLNADAVLEGSVQRANDRVRVSVNLMRSTDGTSLWSDNFDMNQSDVFAIQDRVAQQVATQLKLQLDPTQQSRLMKPQTSSAVAYESYVRAVDSFNQRGYGPKAKPQMEGTISLFRKALEADQNYALAHAQLAYAYAWMAAFIEPQEQEWADRAQEEIDRAEGLDPQLAETHIARHMILFSGYGGWQLQPAIRELRLAQRLNPNVGHLELGALYQHVGLEDLASRELKHALDIDPTSEHIKIAIVGMHDIVRNYDEELAANEKFFHNGEPSTDYLMAKGRLAEAQKRIDKWDQDSPYLPNARALLFALKGDFRSAEQQIPLILSQFPTKDPEYHHGTYDVACVYALEGKSAEAVKWLNETAATGFPCYPLFERDPYLNRIRQSPEFVQFLTRMKELNEKYRTEALQDNARSQEFP